MNGVSGVVDIEVADYEFVDLVGVVRGGNDVETVISWISHRVSCRGQISSSCVEETTAI